MVDPDPPPNPRCHLSVAASASLYFLFLRRLVLVSIRQHLAEPFVSLHLKTRWVAVAVTEEAVDRNVVAGVVGEVVGEDKAFAEGYVVGEDGAADSKDSYLSLGVAIEARVDPRFPSPVVLLHWGIRILDSSRRNIVTAKRDSRGN
jgi:hypothetical protein